MSYIAARLPAYRSRWAWLRISPAGIVPARLAAGAGLVAVAVLCLQLAMFDFRPSNTSDDFTAYVADALALDRGTTYGMPGYILNRHYDVADSGQGAYAPGYPLVLAAVVFLLGVSGLRVYLDWITGTGYTYGALAAPIAFLLATFFIALAIILGAHVNAAIQAEWPAVLRRRGRIVARQQPVGTPDSAPLGLTAAIHPTRPRRPPC